MSTPCMRSCLRFPWPGKPMLRMRRISTSPQRSRSVFKAIIIPVALHRMIVKLGIHREIETVGGIGLTMLLGMGLVALAMVVTLRATEGAGLLAREDLAFALSVVLLGLLMMVARRNAVSQVVGFMSLENAGARRHRRQGYAARGRDQRRLLDPHRLHR